MLTESQQKAIDLMTKLTTEGSEFSVFEERDPNAIDLTGITKEDLETMMTAYYCKIEYPDMIRSEFDAVCVLCSREPNVVSKIANREWQRTAIETVIKSYKGTVFEHHLERYLYPFAMNNDEEFIQLIQNEVPELKLKSVSGLFNTFRYRRHNKKEDK